MQLVGNWNYPTSIKAGAGRVAELGKWCRSLGLTKPLIVTDPGLATMPMLLDARDLLARDGLGVRVFSELRSNPIGRNVDDGVTAFRAGNHDGIVAFGGGSALDVGKAIALMVGQSRPLFDFEDVGDNWLRVAPAGVASCIAVPTTAGTGSEVGRASVITDDVAHVKKIIFHPKMLPAVVILDPELTFGLPEKLTAATGMDALSHCLEAYCVNSFHPLAAGVALEGMRLVKDHLPAACKHPTDAEARMHMLVASSMGATAFQRGLGAMHALAHPLGALYDAHHGMLNAVLMPYVLRANEPAIETVIASAARYLGLAKPTFQGFLDWVLALRAEIGIPHALSALGIDTRDKARVGQMAVEDPSAGGNPYPFTAEQYSHIFQCAVAGEL
ncbi:MAG: iron-containing alcohol dehydrogenase [Polyangiales bacterium]